MEGAVLEAPANYAITHPGIPLRADGFPDVCGLWGCQLFRLHSGLCKPAEAAAAGGRERKRPRVYEAAPADNPRKLAEQARLKAGLQPKAKASRPPAAEHEATMAGGADTEGADMPSSSDTSSEATAPAPQPPQPPKPPKPPRPPKPPKAAAAGDCGSAAASRPKQPRMPRVKPEAMEAVHRVGGRSGTRSHGEPDWTLAALLDEQHMLAQALAQSQHGLGGGGSGGGCGGGGGASGSGASSNASTAGERLDGRVPLPNMEEAERLDGRMPLPMSDEGDFHIRDEFWPRGAGVLTGCDPCDLEGEMSLSSGTRCELGGEMMHAGGAELGRDGAVLGSLNGGASLGAQYGASFRGLSGFGFGLARDSAMSSRGARDSAIPSGFGFDLAGAAVAAAAAAAAAAAEDAKAEAEAEAEAAAGNGSGSSSAVCGASTTTPNLAADEIHVLPNLEACGASAGISSASSLAPEDEADDSEVRLEKL
jgi:hypothetical protein